MDIVRNKKAYFSYEIIEDFEAGIELIGSEIKSLRDKKINLVDSYAVFQGNELFLINARIEPYKNASHFNHPPTRARKLLLHRKELDKLKGKVNQKGMVIVPLSLYFKGQWVKVKLGLGKSKKNFDKRQALKEKDVKREMDRAMKDHR